VADDFGRLAGIVSRADVLSVFCRPDEDIRSEIMYDVITDRFLADPRNFTITVRQGIVSLEGQPETEEIGRGIVADTRHVDGVVTVRDRLTYPALTGAEQRWLTTR
jgi:osmotically-inducible protein OsmY